MEETPAARNLPPRPLQNRTGVYCHGGEMRDARARKETLKAKLPHLQTCLAYPEPALLPSLGPSNKQAGITLECGGYTSFPLEGEDPALPVWQAGLGEELLKRGQVCPGQEQRAPVSSWGLRILPATPSVHFCLCPSPVCRSQRGAQHRCCLRWGATTQAQ